MTSSRTSLRCSVCQPSAFGRSIPRPLWTTPSGRSWRPSPWCRCSDTSPAWLCNVGGGEVKPVSALMLVGVFGRAAADLLHLRHRRCDQQLRQFGRRNLGHGPGERPECSGAGRIRDRLGCGRSRRRGLPLGAEAIRRSARSVTRWDLGPGRSSGGALQARAGSFWRSAPRSAATSPTSLRGSPLPE